MTPTGQAPHWASWRSNWRKTSISPQLGPAPCCCRHGEESGQSLPDDRWTSGWPLLQPGCMCGRQHLPRCPDHVLTSKHPWASGAWCSWGPAALGQRVAADDQLHDIARLGQERHRQAAVKVPRVNVVDLHMHSHGADGVSSACTEVGENFLKYRPCPAQTQGASEHSHRGRHSHFSLSTLPCILHPPAPACLHFFFLI